MLVGAIGTTAAESRFCIEAATEWQQQAAATLSSYEENLGECLKTLPAEVCRDGLGAVPYLDQLRSEVAALPATMPNCAALKRAAYNILAAIDNMDYATEGLGDHPWLERVPTSITELDEHDPLDNHQQTGDSAILDLAVSESAPLDLNTAKGER